MLGPFFSFLFSKHKKCPKLFDFAEKLKIVSYQSFVLDKWIFTKELKKITKNLVKTETTVYCIEKMYHFEAEPCFEYTDWNKVSELTGLKEE